MVKNWVDKEVGIEDDDGAKYAESKPEGKPEDSNNALDASKKDKAE